MSPPPPSILRGGGSWRRPSVRKLSADGTTVVVATHDAEFARACVDRVLLLDHGHVVRDGRPDLVLS